MEIKKYNYEDKIQLTEHFNTKEFRCKCSKKHKVYIADTLPPLLEKLREKLNASAGNIYSGYRCATHDKNVGGNGSSNRSHGGYAVDIIFLDKNRKPIPSKTVALALEDLGHKYGIGYRCGGGSNASGQTHIDVKPRKWYGDESKSMTKSCCSSFYDYFGIKKNSTTATDSKKYIKLTTGVWCRKNGYGFKHPKYKVIPKNTKCELLAKNIGTANGYKWDKVKYNNIVVYLPNKWNKYL